MPEIELPKEYLCSECRSDNPAVLLHELNYNGYPVTNAYCFDCLDYCFPDTSNQLLHEGELLL